MSKDKFQAARDAFLNFIADAKDWGVDYDADVNDAGRQIDCSTYHIRGHIRSLKELCDALEIKYDESREALDVAIIRAIEES